MTSRSDVFSDLDVPDEATRAMDALRRLVAALRSASRTATANVGVTGAQLFVLQQLATKSAQSINEIAALTSTRQNSVSDVVSRLVARGLATRKMSPDDARRAMISLTKSGRAVVRRAPNSVQGQLVESFRELPVRQRKLLSTALEAWLHAAGMHAHAPVMFFERASSNRKPAIARSAKATPK